MKAIRRLQCQLVLALVIFLSLGLHAFAQSQATLTGTVTDASGAVIPNANITITQVETNQVTTVATNSAGQYQAPALNVGHYNVKVVSPGFQPQEKADVVLNVAAVVKEDFSLQVGSTTTTLEVQADAVQVQSDSSDVSNVVTGNQVTNIATNGRNMVSLAELMPGVTTNNVPANNGPTSVGSNFNISFNGDRPDHNDWMVDGGEAYDRGSGGKFEIMPSIDAIGEFRVLTSNYSAEYGMTSGALLTMVFKSGTKQFHGDAWEFFRNNDLDANTFLNNAAGRTSNGTLVSPVPLLKYNVYGFNIGGPVVLPHYNKDRNKTFFFYNMEWRKVPSTTPVNTSVPSTSFLNGNFSSLLGTKQLYVPCASALSSAEVGQWTAAGLTPPACNSLQSTVKIPGNVLPASLISPASQALLSTGIFPTANGGTATDPRFLGSGPANTDVREEIVRVDQQFTDKFSMFGHWVTEAQNQEYATTLWSGSNVPTVNSIFNNPSYSGVVHATYIISPTIVSETAFNYNGNRINVQPSGIYQRTGSYDPTQIFPENAANRLPSVNLAGGTGANYDIGPWPWVNTADDYQGREDLSVTKGTHNIKFGGQYMTFMKTQEAQTHTQGQYTFNGSYTGYDAADLLLGYASSYEEDAIQQTGSWKNNMVSLYVQDNWRATNRLTLNLGLRWDGLPHSHEVDGMMSNFVPSLYNQAAAAVFAAPGTNSNAIPLSSPGVAAGIGGASSLYFYQNGLGIEGTNGVPFDLVKNHWNNWGPRVGFAYDLTGKGKTVVRGGFGTMYEVVQGNDVYNALGNPPFNGGVTQPNVLVNNPLVGVNGQAVAATSINTSSITGWNPDNYKNPTTYQYSVGVQQQFGSKSVLSVSYVGNQGRHENDYTEINDIYPTTSNVAERYSISQGNLNADQVRPYLGYGNISWSENAGNSHYNALQTQYRYQASQSLTLQVAYTYSKAYDEANFGSQAQGDLSHLSDPFNRAYDYGVSTYDVPNVFLANWVYNLPFFQHSNGLVKGTLGGWVVSGVWTWQNGNPVNVTTNEYVAPDGTVGQGDPVGIGGQDTPRPNQTGTPTYTGDYLHYVSNAASIFSAAPFGTFGNAPKNSLRLPTRQNWNISLFKDFAFRSWTEGSKLEFRAESFNTFNHTQWTAMDANQQDGSAFGTLTQNADPRTLQLALKLIF